jgi:hypothetical protein
MRIGRFLGITMFYKRQINLTVSIDFNGINIDSCTINVSYLFV